MLIALETIIPRCKPITGILHIGAHHAEELEAYEKAGVPQVVWVEADPRKASYLASAVCAPPRHRVLCCAATDHDGTVKLRVTSNDGMSSSLLALKLHRQYYPDVVESEQVETRGRRLGPYLDELGIAIGSPGLNFLNIDIQGAELLALLGLGTKVGQFDAIYTEVNTAELYEGAVQLPDLDLFLAGFGFTRVETFMVGEQHWGDALYIKP
jgi:FkbM family methyltransferase